MCNKFIEQRAIASASLLIKRNMTIREIADQVGYSKSTIHKDLVDRLPKIDYELYKNVRQVLDEHLDERAIRGGQSTRELFMKLRNVNKVVLKNIDII